jgi:CheY-like chemotaxis protein
VNDEDSIGKRILCVDDTGDDCELFTLVLDEAGYEVMSAQSFADALQLIETVPFDLGVFDISIPDGTGLELLARVRKMNASIPVIMCTADIREATRQQAMQAGAQALLTKPVDIDRLVETVAQFLPFQSTQLMLY